MWFMLSTGQPILTEHRLDAKMDWDSLFDEEDDFPPIFALLGSGEESEQTLDGSRPRKVKSIDRNRTAGTIQQQRDYFDSG